MASGDSTSLPASAWVVRHAGLVPAGATVLDVAAGGGRHTRLFLERGHPVVAVDRDVSALAPHPSLRIVAADLEDGSPWPLPGERFGGIVVTNYLHRPLFPALLDALLPGGVLIYETFMVGNERLGHPRNPDFLLRPGELRDVLGGRLRVVAFEEGEVVEPRPAVVQRIAAVSPGG
jgi:SAM-dependent methyltransferase